MKNKSWKAGFVYKPPSLLAFSRGGWESGITNRILQSKWLPTCSQMMTISCYTSQKSSLPFNKDCNFSVSSLNDAGSALMGLTTKAELIHIINLLGARTA